MLGSIEDSPMDFRILGPIEVIDAGQPLAIGGAKQRALLGMLLLHANEIVSSDRLLEELSAILKK